MLKRSVLSILSLMMIVACSYAVSFSSDTYKFIASWGSTGSGPGQFNCPSDMAVGSLGNIYVIDEGNNRIEVFKPDGSFLKQWGSSGQFNSATGIAIDKSGNVYVVDSGNTRVQKFTADGDFLVQWPLTSVPDDAKSVGPLSFYAIAVDSAGNIYLSDVDNKCIKKYSATMVFQKMIGAGQLQSPQGIAVNPAGYIYVADYSSHQIKKFSTVSGDLLNQWGEYGSGPGQLDAPCHVALDHQGNVYVGDRYNFRLQKFSAAGKLLNCWGSKGIGDGQFQSNLEGIVVAVDSQGYVYAANYDNRIQKFRHVVV